MYQSPIIAHGFNHQSLYRQPVSNLRQMNDVVWNKNGDMSQINGIMPETLSSATNQQPNSGYTNLGHQRNSTLNNLNNVNVHSQNGLINGYQNNVAKNLPNRRIYFTFILFYSLHFTFFRDSSDRQDA